MNLHPLYQHLNSKLTILDRMKKNLLFILTTSFLIIACAGYHLGNVPNPEMKGVKTIYVPIVKNESFEPSLSVMTTDAILHRIDNDGTYTSSRQREADAILEVRITDVKRTPIRMSRSDIENVDQYQITIQAAATLTNLKAGKKIFENKLVTGSNTYFVSTAMQEAERQSLPAAADDLAQHLISMVTEGW
jgi:hypothetical protein